MKHLKNILILVLCCCIFCSCNVDKNGENTAAKTEPGIYYFDNDAFPDVDIFDKDVQKCLQGLIDRSFLFHSSSGARSYYGFEGTPVDMEVYEYNLLTDMDYSEFEADILSVMTRDYYESKYLNNSYFNVDGKLAMVDGDMGFMSEKRDEPDEYTVTEFSDSKICFERKERYYYLLSENMSYYYTGYYTLVKESDGWKLDDFYTLETAIPTVADKAETPDGFVYTSEYLFETYSPLGLGAAIDDDKIKEMLIEPINAKLTEVYGKGEFCELSEYDTEAKYYPPVNTDVPTVKGIENIKVVYSGMASDLTVFGYFTFENLGKWQICVGANVVDGEFICDDMATFSPVKKENTQIPLTDEDEKAIMAVAENIQQAYWCYSLFIGGPTEPNAPPLNEKYNPYPQTNYYPLSGEYATMESIKAHFSQYYSSEFFEKYVLGELESDDQFPPYLINIDGKLYCNLNYGLGNTPIPELDTIKITNYTGNTAQFEIYRHHPFDESVKNLFKANLIKENGKWVYDHKLW